MEQGRILQSYCVPWVLPFMCFNYLAWKRVLVLANRSWAAIRNKWEHLRLLQ